MVTAESSECWGEWMGSVLEVSGLSKRTPAPNVVSEAVGQDQLGSARAVYRAAIAGGLRRLVKAASYVAYVCTALSLGGSQELRHSVSSVNTPRKGGKSHPSPIRGLVCKDRMHEERVLLIISGAGSRLYTCVQ